MLMARGVNMPQPETVFIGGDVVPERIASGITIHPGCRLTGNKTSVGPGCELGATAGRSSGTEPQARGAFSAVCCCLLYTSDAADE